MKDDKAKTEEKIKQAARIIFQEKGYSATRTRDIAEKAEINLALLNYYFRSKEQLFQLIMLETMQSFFQSMQSVFHNEDTSLKEKIQLVVNNYTDLLLEQPNLPLFLLSELKNNPSDILKRMNIKQLLANSSFFKQVKKTLKKNYTDAPNPLHIIMNIMGMILFPFVANPILCELGDLSQNDFQSLMEERKRLLPQWIMGILKNGKSVRNS